MLDRVRAFGNRKGVEHSKVYRIKGGRKNCGTEFVRLAWRLGKGEQWKRVWYCVHVSGTWDLVTDPLRAMNIVGFQEYIPSTARIREVHLCKRLCSKF